MQKFGICQDTICRKEDYLFVWYVSASVRMMLCRACHQRRGSEQIKRVGKPEFLQHDKDKTEEGGDTGGATSA